MTDFFNNLIHLIDSQKDTVSLAKGEPLYRLGEASHEMYLIKSGVIQLASRPQITELVHKGGIIGEESLIERLPRLADAIALQDCVLMLIDQDRLEVLIKLWPSLPQEIKKMLAERLALHGEHK